MTIHREPALSRRTLLGSLLALPALALAAPPPAGPVLSRAGPPLIPPTPSLDEVLNVMDFEPLARAVLPPAHFGYLATGVDDDLTVVRNHDAFGHLEIRARRFADVSRLDTALSVLGVPWASPIYLSAVSGMRAFHPDAELAVARAAKGAQALLMLSTGASAPLADVVTARGAPVWQQLYATDDWAVTEPLVRRAEQAGCPAIVLTVDTFAGRNNETLQRAVRADPRHCTDCHVNNSHDMWRRAPLFAGLDVSRVTQLRPPYVSPAYLDRLRRLVSGKLLIKGIVTGEDAALALEHGVDGIVVSNHGGRSEETLRATIDCLPEVVAAVRRRVPVLVDGGVRRGTDVFKALALGATAVGIGRPQGWGLAAFGEAGVAKVIEIYNRELRLIMREAGTPTLAAITRDFVVASVGR